MTVPLEHDGLRWGFSTLGCPELTLPEVCRLAYEFQMRELEVRAFAGRTDLPNYAHETGLNVLRVRELLKPFSGRIIVASSDFKLIGGGASQRAEFVEFCRWADAWEIPYVRIFGGGVFGTALTEKNFAEATGNMRWWREERAKQNWRTEILLETHDAFSASAACAQLCEALEQPLGIIWDSHHTWRIAGEKPSESWKQIGQWIRHVHIKDSNDVPSARHPFTYALPGEGQAPLGEIIALLQQKRFDGVVSLEWEKMWHPYLPNLRDALLHLQKQKWFPAPQKISTKSLAQIGH